LYECAVDTFKKQRGVPVFGIDINSMVGFYESFGYVAVFGVLLLCGFGLPIPEDISIIAGGIISGMGFTNVHIMLLICLSGVIIGDSIIYQLGKILGERVFQKKFAKRVISQSWYHRIHKSFEKNGIMVLFAARFMPGLRTPIFLTAGITKFVGFGKFLLIDGIAALISVPVWTYLGYYGAKNREKLGHMIRDTKIGILIILAVIILVYVISRILKNKLAKAEIIVENGTSDDNDKK